MEVKRGKYKNKENTQEVELVDIGNWVESESRAIAIFIAKPFDIPQCCFLKTFKEKYVPIETKEELHMKENWWINDYRVIVKLKGEIVASKVVRSKAPRTAITNVLTNIYTGDMDNVEIEQLTFHTKEGTL